MEVIGSRTFATTEEEHTVFTVRRTSEVTGVIASVDAGPAGPLPVSVTGHHDVTVNVGFSSQSGGFAEIDIAGSEGGTTTDRIVQMPSLPFRNRVYTLGARR